MSVVSRNPFDLLGDGDSPSPAPVTKTAAPAAKPAEPAAPPKEVPGSKAGRGRGQGYYSRGGPRNVLKGAASPASPAGEEPESGFEGERRSPGSNDLNNRGTRPSRGRGGGDRARGRGGARRGGGEGGHFRGPGGGDRGHGDRRSHHALPDTEKKVASGWGDNEGEAELAAEVEGAKDASAEAAAPGTPAEGETPVDAAPAEPTPEDEARAAAKLAEEEEAKLKSYDDYLAEKTKAALGGGLGKLEARKVEGVSDFVGAALKKEEEAEWLAGAGKKDTKATEKAKAPKKEKVFIEIEGRFAPPAGSERSERGARGGRGGDRGASRGSRGTRGTGAPRGRGAPRGAPRAAPGPSVDDATAFPALGA